MQSVLETQLHATNRGAQWRKQSVGLLYKLLVTVTVTSSHRSFTLKCHFEQKNANSNKLLISKKTCETLKDKIK